MQKKFRLLFYIAIGGIIISLIEILLSFFNLHLSTYMIIAGTTIVTLIALLIICTVNKNFRKWYNYLSLGILLVIWLTSFFQFGYFMLAYVGREGGVKKDIAFIFPCLFKMVSNYNIYSESEIIATAVKEDYAVCLEFLSSLTLIISCIICNYRNKSKK